MNRDGQIWLDLNDTDEIFLVVDGPLSDEEYCGPYYRVLRMTCGSLSQWGSVPKWESDSCLKRIL